MLDERKIIIAAQQNQEKLDQEAKADRDRNATSVQVATIGANRAQKDTSQMTGTAMLAAKTEALKQAQAVVATGEDDEYNNATTGKAKMDRVKAIAKEFMVVQGLLPPSAEQPKPQTQAPPTVGEVRDGYKYNGGAYDSESSWSKV